MAHCPLESLLFRVPPSPFANLNPNLMLKASTMTHNHRPQWQLVGLRWRKEREREREKGKVLFLVAIITEIMLKWFLSVSKTVIFADGAYQILGRLILELINGAQS